MLQTDSDVEGNSTSSVLLQNSSDFKYLSRKTRKVYFHLENTLFAYNQRDQEMQSKRNGVPPSVYYITI